MAIPDFQSIMLPFLRFARDGNEHSIQEATEFLADEFRLQKAAIEAADAWLKMVDEGWYLRSWREGSTYFKNAVSQGQWIQSMAAYMKALGKTISRYLTSAQ